MLQPVYLDYNATTPVAPEVLQAMLPFLAERWGNPSSAYSFGHSLTAELDKARAHVAALVNASPREIVFTSCGTESINTAMQSALALQPGKRRIVTTAIEHSATMRFCASLEKQGCVVTYLPVDANGLLDLDQARRAVTADTAIVSVMWANNETGMILPIQVLAGVCRERGVLFHTDAVQAAGKIPVDARAAGVDFLSLSAHKLHAPKGTGALFVRHGAKFHPHIIGGGQERGRRGGTENVAGIVAFGRAAELAKESLGAEASRLTGLRNRLEREILARIPGAARNGPESPRLPNTTNIAFENVEAEGVLMLLDQAGICASSGSACTTGSMTPSHVLTALGCSPSRARSSLRLSIGRYTTERDIDHLLQHLPGIIDTLRMHAPAQTVRAAFAPSGR